MTYVLLLSRFSKTYIVANKNLKLEQSSSDQLRGGANCTPYGGAPDPNDCHAIVDTLHFKGANSAAGLSFKTWVLWHDWRLLSLTSSHQFVKLFKAHMEGSARPATNVGSFRSSILNFIKCYYGRSEFCYS
ncbi:hypothetical protein K435DRAFT_797987 [Dendrothele bispora CBS 962.96]|uniref:Uncharacterized protein n=1 Tax=Dendrothele bispora (strain CBS 962.96) TaxID=1314807 RepID=A0A4S8M0M5_DENBC|nr:hypothetical protein K435DRAFT_797987 [Dendrothele bispora CBS 962.96]